MKIILGFILVALSLIVYAGTTYLNVNKKQSSFVINLASNPTTGFQWNVVSYDKDLLTLKSSTYQPSNAQLIGADGKMLFVFALNKGKAYPKTTNLIFKYARPWEKESSKKQKVTVHFVSPK